VGLCTQAIPFAAHAQGNYEIQVYGSETVAPRSLMVELHSNYTAVGQKNYIDGQAPTNHAVHETLELTQGINYWSEVGFYAWARNGWATTSAPESAFRIAGAGR